ncbi:hypothetical protein DPMN_072939 [Dreissena polymorpha]|uniref:Uncharacterized protein n=1 Tax=Dreissena polymorpha TaxID=45954 RepID=A0A9D4BY57_DREPO|nr:hypothetical protein DPMN_072939 [Dreissena polymorpha]
MIVNINSKWCQHFIFPYLNTSVNGQWSEWGHWSECSATCGEGQITRKRLCNSPNPDNGGEFCLGYNIDTGVCNDSRCRSKLLQP